MIIVLLMESEILKMKLMKSLNLKDKFLKLPIIQGGMGIGVSRCRLAGAVAKEGGMGVLSTAQIGYDDPDFTKHPEETNNVKRNGWLHTGDIGKFDNEGYLYIVGRIKNMIISGGLNIYPEEIEEVLITHDDIKDVVVIGETHDILGEIPVAKIVTDNRNLTVYDIIGYCAKFLDKYKIPKKIIFCDELEKTYTGKIIRKQKTNSEE